MLVRHEREWFALQAGTPGVEVYRDPDITWKLSKGVAWLNAGVGLRFKPQTVELRLDEILARYAKHGRGASFWVDVDATPMDLEVHLKERRLRCRKYFAGMACDLSRLPEAPAAAGITIERVTDYGIYARHPHPMWGRINTPIRKAAFESIKHLTSAHADRVMDFAALDGSRPVGACLLYLGRTVAGIHDVGVAETERGRGVGTAMIGHVLRFARERGQRYAVLISSEMGFGMYQRAGFREVCRMGFWYKAPARC